ncbi:cyclic nucleotide-binding domain-containing protein [Catenulispora subtropica]|uniref:Cyclic nucleotide-binding domain-containing protein n=1 Tax=Catenulispora subtropica TaxID=450798 RepID=A0ABN2RLP0_9ACTN
MADTLRLRIAAHPFSAPFPEDQRELLAREARPVEFEPDERIFAEGGAADRFWLIETGRVALDMWVPGRDEQVVETLPEGTVLGWSWLTPPYRWHFGARALEHTTAVMIDAAAVRERSAADPVFGYAVLSRFAPLIIERLQATRLRMLDLHATPQEIAETRARRAISPDSPDSPEPGSAR